MKQLSLRVRLPQESADAICDLLLASGALAVNVEDAAAGTHDEQPIFAEPGAEAALWDSCVVDALFDGTVTRDDALAFMQSALDSVGAPEAAIEVKEVSEIDWVAHNREQFQPIQISPRIWIVPTWHEAPDPQAINLSLDPGSAFGTGSHPTTRLCLQWIEAVVDASCGSFLDYGTGSGILAIAAKKLGAQCVVGTDIDPIAVEAARYNATQNQTAIEFQSNESTLDFVADITVANILANPLKVLAPLLASHTRSGGKLALAGLLDEQADELIAIYAPYFSLSTWRSAEGWTCLAGVRK